MSNLGTDLIGQAKILANLEAGRPKQASVRRSISTAYYGLFHFLIEESTYLVVGAAHADVKNRQLVGRAFVHGKMRSLCQEFTWTQVNQTHLLLRPFLAAANAPSKASMALVAQTFVNLQDDRHSADYDLSVSFSRSDAMIAYQRAHDAVTTWNRLLHQDREFCRFFALSLSFWPSLASR
jgi:hypothetical protein